MKRILCLILWFSVPLFAAADLDIAHVDIIASPSNASAMDLAKGIQYALQNAKLGVDANIQKPEGYKNNNPAATLVIAIGDSSLPWLIDQRHTFATAIAFHVSSAAFLAQTKPDQRLTALYRDQPLSRQLQLAKFLLPNSKRASVLHNSAAPLAAAKELKIGLAEIRLSNNPDWLKILAQSLRDTDFLLGVDDASIYNGDTIRSILLTTYRQGKSLIGPSRSFVNAGSLASCYTSTDQYLQQLVDMVTVVVREHRVPDAQFPKIFRIAVNRQVANSLNIPIPDEDVLSAWPQNYSGDCGNGC